MKLAIFFLLCSVSLSLQQFYYPGHHDYRMAYFNPRNLYYPQPIAHSPDYNEHLSSDYADVEGRIPTRGSSTGGKSRFFGTANLLAALLNTNNVNTPISIPFIPTITSTILQTTTSTVTTPVIKSCIGSTQFAVAGAAAPFTTSTQTCARRRRGINIEEMMAIEALSPTPVESLEFSVAPIMTSSSRDGRSENQPEILSSQDLPIEKEERGINRQKRSVIISVTSTITAYSFTATTIVKSFTLAAAQAQGVDGKGAGLLCLPSGYTIC